MSAAWGFYGLAVFAATMAPLSLEPSNASILVCACMVVARITGYVQGSHEKARNR